MPNDLVVTIPARLARPADADATDERLIAMWLHGRSPNTQRAYRRDVARFTAFTAKPLAAVTLGDLQDFADTITGKNSSRSRVLASVRSLLSFCVKLGAVQFNVGTVMQRIKSPDGLADRIISEPDVMRMLAVSDGRNHALVRFLYASGARVSEAVNLKWESISDAPDGGIFVSLFGKGGKTRSVRISPETAAVVRALRSSSPYVFAGRNGKPIDPSTAWRLVRGIAEKAGITKRVSPHFMRHAHATHAIERGSPTAVVRDTLGHSSIAVTDRYLHARPGESSGRYLAV